MDFIVRFKMLSQEQIFLCFIPAWSVHCYTRVQPLNKVHCTSGIAPNNSIEQGSSWETSKSTIYFRRHNNMVYLLNFNTKYIIILATCFDSYESSS